MKQINNGFADYYYLRDDGSVYNAAEKIDVQISDNHIYTLRTNNSKRKKISLKTLYKLVFNKVYSKDSIKDLDGEIWKDIDDTEGFYKISNKGRCKSLHGYNTILLKPFCNKSGYARIDINVHGKRQTKLLHRLVAAAFLPLPDKAFMELHHKDFNKNRNDAENIQWLTHDEHIRKHKEREKNVCTKSEKNNHRKKK